MPIIGWTIKVNAITATACRTETKRERTVIDDRGFTVETLPKQRTQAQIDTDAKAKAETDKQQQDEEKERAESAAYDNLLLTSYQDVAAIEHVRNDRLSLLDASMLVAIQTHADNTRHLIKLRDEQKVLLEQGKPVPAKLQKSMKSVISRIQNNEVNINELQRQKADTAEKYQRDIERFTILKSAAN